MKKTLITILLAGAALQQLALSQTNSEAPPMTTMAMTNAVATNAPEMATTAPTATDSSETNPPEISTPAPTATPAMAQTIPLIQFQDVPLTTAIDNLARQAGINYLMDPKIGFGQPDANGQIKPEPTLSIRWENITAANALTALLNNYNLQLVEDPKIKISRITTKDPLAPPPLETVVVQLKYASVSNMMSAVAESLTDKRSRVIPDYRTSQLVVVATDKEQTDVQGLVDQLDKPTRQVLIETRLVEVSSNPSTTKGINWSGTLSAQNVSFGNTSQFLTPPTPPTTTTTSGGAVVTTPGSPGLVNGVLANPAVIASTVGGFGSQWFLNADGVKAVLSFLNSSSDAQVVSTPRVVTLDNETAHIAVTRSFPIFTSTAGTANTPGGSSVTYSNLGTTLDVTPHISANDYIWLKVVPTVSSFFGDKTETSNGQPFSAPQFDSRSIETQVLIPNANTLVMGGLVKDTPQESFTKVPVLGDIPWLGYAFRSESKSVDKVNLLIFLTPTIVQDSDFRPTTTDFLKSLPKTTAEPVNANSMWESSKPRNWSDPTETDPTSSVINQKTTD